MKFPELSALYHRPLFDLMSQSRAVHVQHWRGEEVQRCSLLSIKTGGCSKDCAYCAQSAHYSTGLAREELLSLEEVMTAAHRARSQGATRFCMGAAWRSVRDGSEKFERVLEIVREVSRLGMEVCVTLGEIGSMEAHKLKAAGVTAYNHNLDTSPEFYPEIVSTHTFQNRLDTIAAVQESGMSVCCGGIRLSREGQALCFFAGANSIFYGDKLLTAKNPTADVDVALLRELGLDVESRIIPNAK